MDERRLGNRGNFKIALLAIDLVPWFRGFTCGLQRRRYERKRQRRNTCRRQGDLDWCLS